MFSRLFKRIPNFNSICKKNALGTRYQCPKTSILCINQTHRQFLQNRTRSFTANGPQAILEALNEQATALRDADKFEDALKMYKEIIEGLGDEEGLNSGYVYGSMALCHLSLNDHNQALYYYHRAIPILRSVHGEEFPLIAILYGRMGLCYSLLNPSNFDKSLYYLKKALPILVKEMGSDHADVQITYHNLAILHLNHHKFRDAAEYFKALLSIQMSKFGADHPVVKQSQEAIDTCEKNMFAAIDDGNDKEKEKEK